MAAIIALLGCALVGAGSALFFPNTPHVPVLSDGDWPRLIVIFLGAGWSLLGTVQFLRFGKGWLAKSLLVFIMLGALGCTGMMTYWVLDYSYQLPPPVDLAGKPEPKFELADQNGNKVSDLSLHGKPCVLIFSRGVW